MKKLTEIELLAVTGGWDWARTGRAALTGAGLTFNAGVGAGRNLAGTPGAYVGGALGAVSSVIGTPLIGAEMAGLDALDQAHGRSELKVDSANIRAGGAG
jgi:hypothetical protein